MNTLKTNLLEIGYETGGPRDGRPVLLLHGCPDDVRGWRGMVPHLERAGFRWAAPWLRGFGSTRFLSPDTIRDGSGVALAQDAIDLADHLGWTNFTVVGHDWGARAAYTLSALFSERVSSVIAIALSYSPGGRFPTPAFEQSRRWWYQWFMTTDRGAEAVRRDPKGFARIVGHVESTRLVRRHRVRSHSQEFREWRLHKHYAQWIPEPMEDRAGG
jgi:pimeloyl-ACP methyl ester carboxylesterase